METVRSSTKFSKVRKPVWIDIAGQFPDDRDCLAAFLAFEAAEVLAGVKPSALINLPDRQRSCGKNFFAIWKEHGQNLIRESSLEGTVLVERPESLLLFLYDRGALCRLLADKKAVAMLRKAGYAAEFDLDSLLTELGSRFVSGAVPHEIGIILGYPLKDVAGFMGISRRQFSCQGPWKIYGNPKESLLLAETHRQCRSRMAGRLLSGWGPYQCLGSSHRSAGTRQKDLFYSVNENESHYREGGLAA
ncbi:MAG: DUF3793 family protein [Deltaproteobacteria bacterium]|nr:DUF3793 family protein [Deltaproteobacteria bacterium]TLN04245.1 MAG: DUF3793 family protein [bacterium]